MVKMSGLGDRKTNQLSGGQQQRVALARALVVRPRCLMLDEPLSNLDAKLRIEMRGEIRRICKEFGLTAIYVTHDQKEALSIADRMAILDAGHIAQIGAPEDVYRNPHTATVASFIGETNFIAGEVTGEGGTSGTFRVSTKLGPFDARAGDHNWSPANGESVMLSIRPECLSINAEKPAHNFIAGHLTESVYLGEIAQYALQTTGNDPETIHIAELNPRRVLRDHEATFYAAAEVEDVVMVPAPN